MTQNLRGPLPISNFRVTWHAKSRWRQRRRFLKGWLITENDVTRIAYDAWHRGEERKLPPCSCPSPYNKEDLALGYFCAQHGGGQFKIQILDYGGCRFVFGGEDQIELITLFAIPK